jgi:hypothetical protein
MVHIANAADVEMYGNATVSGTMTANSFSGSGAGLTNIPGAQITSTTINTTQLVDSAVTTNKLATDSVTASKVAFFGRVAIVAATGGDYSNPATAMANYSSWCGVPSSTNTCLLKIMPGVYNLGTTTMSMQPYIDIEGSGENVTILQGNVNNWSGLVSGANNAELRFLTLNNIASGTSVGVSNGTASPRLTNVTISASAGTSWNIGVNNTSASPILTNVTISTTASGSGWSIGIENRSGSAPVMTNVKIDATGSSSWNIGVDSVSSSPIMRNVTITAMTSGGWGIGVDTSLYNVTDTSTIKIHSSVIKGTDSISNGAGVTTYIANTQLDGSVSNSGTLTCVGAFKGNYAVTTSNCN